MRLIPRDEVSITKLLDSRLSQKALIELDDFLTKTHKGKEWPPIGRCVRIAILIKDYRNCKREAKTPEDKRFWTTVLRNLESGRIFGKG